MHCFYKFVKIILFQVQNTFSKIVSSLVLVIFIKDGIREEISGLYLPFNSRFLLVEEQKGTSKFKISGVYQIGMNGSKIFSSFGTWDEKGELKVPEENFYSRRMDLRGHVINIPLVILNV